LFVFLFGYANRNIKLFSKTEKFIKICSSKHTDEYNKKNKTIMLENQPKPAETDTVMMMKQEKTKKQPTFLISNGL